MKSSVPQRNWNLCPVKPFACGLWLTVAVTLAYLLCLPIAMSISGKSGAVASGLGATVCLVAALIALVPLKLFEDPADAVKGMLASMLVRMGLVLACCLLVRYRGGSLAEAGTVNYIIVFYMVTLAIETWMVVGRLAPLNSKSQGM